MYADNESGDALILMLKLTGRVYADPTGRATNNPFSIDRSTTNEELVLLERRQPWGCSLGHGKRAAEYLTITNDLQSLGLHGA